MADALRAAVLKSIADNDCVNSTALAAEHNADHQAVIGTIKSLQTFEGLIEATPQTTEGWYLSPEGQDVVTNGSHELRVLAVIPDAGISKSELESSAAFVALGAAVTKLGMQQATRLKLIKMEKSADKTSVNVTKIAEAPVDALKAALVSLGADNTGNSLGEDNAKVLKDLKKRKLVTQKITKSLTVKKGPDFSQNPTKAETGLTMEMMQDGSWKDKKFQPFNLDALGASQDAGILHPLLKVRREYRELFLELGFEEMPTNRFVESSFWNFDALFQPQQHPARDAHDTFFISDPATSENFPAEYLQRVKDTHENGGETGSIGYRMDWKLEEAQKNILRTHTTAVSARMLYQLAQQKPFKPAKYFSIDRVFRNETLDMTHLAEFHQIEGVMAAPNLTLGDLMGTLDTFFKRLGIENLQFKPAYNPYTEPSMEIFAYHEGLDKVVEIGNSGVFRPEMLLPMGLPEDVVVIAWGLSLERPTMIKYGYSNIRDLMGPKVDLKMSKENPICRI